MNFSRKDSSLRKVITRNTITSEVFCAAESVWTKSAGSPQFQSNFMLGTVIFLKVFRCLEQQHRAAIRKQLKAEGVAEAQSVKPQKTWKSFGYRPWMLLASRLVSETKLKISYQTWRLAVARSILKVRKCGPNELALPACSWKGASRLIEGASA